MRLLKTGPYLPGKQKLELVQKWGRDIPPYAILSHTWSKNPDDEVLFTDVQNGTSTSKPALSKLWKAIERAKLDGYGFLWIDTACIDKSSSVELSEAINSMYRYYKDAQKCYAYLADVSTIEEFEASRWWLRGWTLQELLAPNHLEFFSSSWEALGTKSALHSQISSKTTIEVDYLLGRLPVQHASVAMRMSWAASRETTRDEDIAYCLMGIFNVNMAMLYGEGATKAFIRLQEEIMKGSEDQSLFAWIKSEACPDDLNDYHGLLADSPKDFKHTGSTIPYSEIAEYSPSSTTARGVHSILPLTQKNNGTFIAALRCPVPSRGYNDWLAVYLKRLATGADQYARVTCRKLASVSELGRPQELYVRQEFPNYTEHMVYPYHFFRLRRLHCVTEIPQLSIYSMERAVCAIKPSVASEIFRVQREPWSDVPLVYQIDKTEGALTAGILVRRVFDQESFILMLGSSSEFDVGFGVCEGISIESIGELQREFNPRTAGTPMELEYHTVRISVEERVQSDQKIYLVDVEIEAIPKQHTIVEMLQDTVDIITQPLNSDQRTNKAAVREKFKRLWPR